jgi:hypothetical protein
MGGDYLYLTEENPVGEFELRNVPDDRVYRLWLLSRTENGAEADSRSSWTVKAAGGREPSGYAPFSYEAPATTSFIDPSERSAVFGTRVSEWYGWAYTRELPWLYHYEHGWQFVQDPDARGAVLFDSKLGWIFAGRDFYPVMYAYAWQDWVLYQEGGLPDRRRFLPLGDPAAEWILVE